jgi:hypothetical protein
MRRANIVLLSLATVVPLLAACGTDGRSDQTSTLATSETTTSQAPSPDASGTDVPTVDTPAGDPVGDLPTFPDNTTPQSAQNAGEWDLVFTDVRVAEHGTFDRIVLEFTGTGIPGWAVSFVDKAVLDGSGEAVALGGDAILDIYASGTTWPAPGYYSGPRQLQPPNGGHVDDVYVGGTFEGYTQVLVGIDSSHVPFRAFALTDPSRLVVDVVDDSSD